MLLTHGRMAEKDVLGLVVPHLVAQLGSQNPVLKGTAYMQVSETCIT